MSERLRIVREISDVRTTRQAARVDAHDGNTRTVTRKTLRPFSANGPDDPNTRMSPARYASCEEATAFRMSYHRERDTTCDLHADLTSQPQGPPENLGLTDGSYPELPPPTEEHPTARRRLRERIRAIRTPT